MSNTLFRREVLDAKRSSWLGGISLAQPLALWLLAAFAVFAASVTVCFMAFGEYTRRTTVTGQLIPDLGLSTVVAPISGVVARLYPEEGAHVGASDALALINFPRATASGSDALTVIRESLDTRRNSLQQLAQSEIAKIDAQMAGNERQLVDAKTELVQIEDEIATRREQVRIGNDTLRRYQILLDREYLSPVRLNEQQQSVLALLNAQQALERQATSIRRTIAQLEQTLRELPAQRNVLAASSRRDLAQLDQERVQQESSGELLIKAPVPGLVASQLIVPGQAIQAGQALMSLLPDGSKLQAQLLVPSRAVGFIEPGDQVLLRYQAYPYQKFGHHSGRVIRVSRSAITSRSDETQNTQSNEPYYRVLVALEHQSVVAYGKPEALRPGMLLDADIMSERRKLYEWALEPLYSISGKNGEPKPEGSAVRDEPPS